MRTFINRVLLQSVLFLVCATVLYEHNKSDPEQGMSSMLSLSEKEYLRNAQLHLGH